MPPQSSFCILYIEDNPANLELIAHIFSAFPQIQLISAKNGEEGIQLAEKNIPHLILMDINLPGDSGIEVFRKLKLVKATQNIPVMAVTAYAMKNDMEQALNEGFVDYVTKPFEIKYLLEKIGNILKCDLNL